MFLKHDASSRLIDVLTVPEDVRQRRHPSASSTATVTTATAPTLNGPPVELAKRASVNYRLQGANILAQIKRDVLAKTDAISWASQSKSSLVSDFEKPQVDTAGEIVEVEEQESLKVPTVPRPKKKSPRKLLRRISAADEVDKEVTGDMSLVDSPLRKQRQDPEGTVQGKDLHPHKFDMVVPPTIVFTARPIDTPTPLMTVPTLSLAASTTPVVSPSLLPASDGRRQPTTLPASLHPNHAPASHDDMSRFVSSSTASGISGTTAGSFVKHPGPPLAAHMRTIRPEEVQGVLPAKVGGMAYSAEKQMWIKEVEEGGESVSDDPFGDIESLDATTRSERSRREDVVEDVVERSFVVKTVPELRGHRDEDVVQHEDDIDSDEDGQVPPPPVINPHICYDSDFSTTDEEGPSVLQADDRSQPRLDVLDEQQADPQMPKSTARSLEELSEGIAHISLQMDLSPPRPARPRVVRAPPATPSSSRPQIFPRSALKPTPQRGASDPVTSCVSVAQQTPRMGHQDASHRRSVSFSDGRKTGKIRGLTSPGQETEEMTEQSHIGPALQDEEQPTSSYVPSARTKRITNLLEGLDDESGES